MTNTVRALIVPADDTAPVEHRSISGDRDTVLGLVADYNTDTVFLSEADAVAVVAASGKSGKPVNPRATTLVELFLPGFAKRDRVHGDVVFLGVNDGDDPSAVYADVPEQIETMAGNHFSVLGP